MIRLEELITIADIVLTTPNIAPTGSRSTISGEMISIKDATRIGLPETSLLKVSIRRQVSSAGSIRGMTIKQAVLYIESHDLIADQICSTVEYFVFYQKPIVKGAAFIYEQHSDNIIYTYQKFKKINYI